MPLSDEELENVAGGCNESPQDKANWLEMAEREGRNVQVGSGGDLCGDSKWGWSSYKCKTYLCDTIR